MHIQPYLFFDGRCQEAIEASPSRSRVPSASEAERLFGALVEGGQVTMPLAATFFSPRFGMTTDRFGVSWMVYVAP